MTDFNFSQIKCLKYISTGHIIKLSIANESNILIASFSGIKKCYGLAFYTHIVPDFLKII